MTTYLTAFNNIVFNFVDDLIETFPEERDFDVYKRTFLILKGVNAKKMCILFKNYSFIYRDKINNQDESFFINNDYNEIKEDNDAESIGGVIEKLKYYWKEMSTENKEKIWKYLSTMIKLSELVE